MFRLLHLGLVEDGGIVTKDGGYCPETDYMLHHAYYPVTLIVTVYVVWVTVWML